MKKNINILDCTLRDGGYYNNWEFSTNLINSYLNSIYKSGIDYAEIGFRSFHDSSYKGPCAYSSDIFLTNLNIPEKLKIGVMVNAADLLSHGNKNPVSNIKKLFSSKKSRINFIRIACHFEEFHKVVEVSKYLKKKNFIVIFNLMQCSERSESEVIKVGELAAKYPIDVLYFADSMGSMDSIQVNRIVNLLRLNWKKQLGIHTHDNMSRAFTNTDQAIKDGVNWIDGTVMGMGRGPGNIKTEYLLINYSELLKKTNIRPILNLIEKFFKPLHLLYNWGPDPFYFLAGKNGIHPTFIQDILKDKRYSVSEKILFIEHLKSFSSNKFDKNLLDLDRKIYANKTCKRSKKRWIPSSSINKKTVLIIGNSPELKENLYALEEFIKKKKPIVFGLNTQKSVNEKLINYRVVCNLFRLLTDKYKYRSIKTPLILPLERLDKKVIKFLRTNKTLNFDLQVIPEKFKFNKDSVICPNSLVFCYALAIAVSGKASNIVLAGFNGFNPDDPRQLEMERSLSIFNSKSKIKISSITATKYKIKAESLYA
jgi:4-hydroxy 2-oxovalerate aldolase